MNWREVLAHPSVDRVARVRGYSQNMAEHLAKAIANFCDFMSCGVDEALDRIRGMGGEEIIGLFRDYFIERKPFLAPKTIWNWSNAIKIWLYENGVDIDPISKKITREYRRYVSHRGIPKLLKRDIIEKDEIRRILLASDIRTRALIAVLASSGLRVGVSGLRLQLRHFRDPLDKELPCYMLEIPEELTKAEYGQENPHITFISREARDFLIAYLRKRESMREKLTPESYLFVTYRNGKPEPLTYRGALHLWERACEAAGIDRRPIILPSGRMSVEGKNKNKINKQTIRYNIRFHSLRKYFKTACSLMGVDRLATEAMMGHSLTQFGIESVYDYCIAHLDWLRDQYLKALPALTFVAELPPEVSAVNHQARQRLEELEQKVQALEEANKFYEALLKHLQRKNPRLLKELGID